MAHTRGPRGVRESQQSQLTLDLEWTATIGSLYRGPKVSPNAGRRSSNGGLRSKEQPDGPIAPAIAAVDQDLDGCERNGRSQLEQCLLISGARCQ